MKIKKSIILILFLFLICFVSCDIEEAINNTPTATYQLDKSNIGEEIELSKFDLSDLKILVRYGSEVKGEFDVNESMITQEDLEKLNQVGKHTITINYKDWSEQIEITLIDNNSSGQPDQPNPPQKDDKLVVTYIDDNKYYQNAVGKNENELKLALRKTINTGIKRVSYSSLNTYLAKTDASPNDPNKILLFYTRKEISNKWDSGTTWNKEHVWPRSVGWFQYEEAGCDAHHIRAVDSKENSARGNKPYGTGSGYYTPADNVKGDVARIIFYLLVCYEEADNYNVTKVAKSMDMLLQWNELDPVDDIERKRNEEVYKIQNNRNPFIDYSDYAYYIWDQSYLKTETSSNEIDFTTTHIVCCIVENKNKKAFLKSLFVL